MPADRARTRREASAEASPSGQAWQLANSPALLIDCPDRGLTTGNLNASERRVKQAAGG